MRDTHNVTDTSSGPALDLTLVLGGTRSGKSAFAEKCVADFASPATTGTTVLYVATAEPKPDDPAMQERIRRHQTRRPDNWITLECPQNPAATLATFFQTNKPDVVLLDCVTLWMSNILFSLPNSEDVIAFEDALEAEVSALLEMMTASSCHWVLVSGETGLGLVAPTAIGRVYCDGLGHANQLLAAAAKDVFLVIAGRCIRL